MTLAAFSVASVAAEATAVVAAPLAGCRHRRLQEQSSDLRRASLAVSELPRSSARPFRRPTRPAGPRRPPAPPADPRPVARAKDTTALAILLARGRPPGRWRRPSSEQERLG